jgi:hypothetical protein
MARKREQHPSGFHNETCLPMPQNATKLPGEALEGNYEERPLLFDSRSNAKALAQRIC